MSEVQVEQKTYAMPPREGVAGASHHPSAIQRRRVKKPDETPGLSISKRHHVVRVRNGRRTLSHVR
jgi:hypothetical protein